METVWLVILWGVHYLVYACVSRCPCFPIVGHICAGFLSARAPVCVCLLNVSDGLLTENSARCPLLAEHPSIRQKNSQPKRLPVFNPQKSDAFLCMGVIVERLLLCV